jgi:hypothetical protein
MFNVVVSFGGEAWESNDVLSLMKLRFTEYSGTEATGIDIRKPETLALLDQTDALLMYERGSPGQNADVVRYGKVHSVRSKGSSLLFHFRELGRVSLKIVEQYAGVLYIEEREFTRTHWAIKNGSIDRLVLNEVKKTQPRYDVALSFAGTQRDYVREVADYLIAHQVAVFYDKFEEVEMWGKDLVEHFDNVYRLNAKHCVMFVSKEYADGIWTSLERRSALAAALTKKGDYILMVKFDETELPGIPHTLKYLKAKEYTPEKIGEAIIKTIGR